ncbi:MAG: AAA family ATPase [Verrucomicrobiota bacterium]
MHSWLQADELVKLESALIGFKNLIASYPEPLRFELTRTADAWLELTTREYLKAQRAGDRESVPQIFRAGEQIAAQEAFLPRFGTVGNLERELAQGHGRPALLIYGRRRLGKSTLIRNLRGFVPEHMRAAVVSCLDPTANPNESAFAKALADAAAEAWPDLEFPDDAEFETFADFSRTWLGPVNDRLQQRDRMLMFAIDEFEKLDERIGEGKFGREFLPTIRDSIQRHANLAWAFVGAHDLSELKHAEWSSHFVGLRTLEMEPFSLKETRQLLTEPLKYADETNPSKQRVQDFYASGFWGEGAIERIYEETGGWCFLVQAAASNVVKICNEREVSETTPEIVEAGLAETVSSANVTLSNLMLQESREHPAAWDYLKQFRTKTILPEPEDDKLRLTLKRHLLVEPAGEEDGRQLVKLRFPIMKRWVEERA